MKNDVLPEAGSGVADVPVEDQPTDVLPVAPRPRSPRWRMFWEKWFPAFKQVLPLVVALHLATFVISCLTQLFSERDYNKLVPSISTLWNVWNRWDTVHFLYIAQHGYTDRWRTAFFPLYPMLIHGTMFIIHSPMMAALIVSNLAGIVMLVVLYQLVQEEFDSVRASRTVLYFSLFPTSFFLLAAYNESLFICLTLLSFYQMRHGRWWLAGLFGLLSALTRPSGVLLVLPFAYEYLRQRDFQWKKIRFNVLSLLLVPAGLGLFALYCYRRFHDLLAFSHAQAYWARFFEPPWYSFSVSLNAIAHNGVLSYVTLRNMVDLLPDVFVLILIVLGIFGPWRLQRKYWFYLVYAVAMFIYAQCFPVLYQPYPLQAVGRYMLEIFPAFFILGTLGKYRYINYCYLLVGTVSCFALLMLFLLRHWII